MTWVTSKLSIGIINNLSQLKIRVGTKANIGSSCKTLMLLLTVLWVLLHWWLSMYLVQWYHFTPLTMHSSFSSGLGSLVGLKDDFVSLFFNLSWSASRATNWCFRDVSLAWRPSSSLLLFLVVHWINKRSHLYSESAVAWSWRIVMLAPSPAFMINILNSSCSASFRVEKTIMKCCFVGWRPALIICLIFKFSLT